MMRFRDWPIRSKLTFAMVGVSIAAVVFVAALRVAYQLAMFKSDALEDLTATAEIVAENCAAAVEFDSAQTAQETLSLLEVQPDIVAACVYRKDGSVLAGYHSRQGMQEGKEFPAVADAGARLQHGHLVMYQPVRRGGERVGMLYLHSDLRAQYRRLITGIEIAFVAMAGAILLATLLSLRLQRVLAGPIVHLAKVVEQVTRREDYSVRATRAGADEIGALTDGFNQMLETIGERDARLRAEEQQFRQLAESIREVFWLSSADKNTMVYVSPVYEQVWGRPCADLYAAPRSWLDAIHPEDRDRIQRAAMTKQVAGTYDEEYRIVRPDGSVAWIRDRAFPIRDAHTGQVYRVAGLAEDVTETKKNRESLRRLSVQILQSQDDERRRIARELHDTTAQDLIGLGLTLANLNRAAALTPVDHQQLAEALELVKKCTHELRTLSYVLHPPSLEELGLPAAVRFYVQGFSKRTNIAVTLDVNDDLDRFGSETELALFRVLQESLTNIQKHSGSTTARLRLAADGHQVVLEVHDNGRGIAGPGNGGEVALGVGLSSMRERLEQLGGELVLQSNDGGTSVRAALPVTVA